MAITITDPVVIPPKPEIVYDRLLLTAITGKLNKTTGKMEASAILTLASADGKFGKTSMPITSNDLQSEFIGNDEMLEEFAKWIASTEKIITFVADKKSIDLITP